jgi:hypothetical protein
MNRPRSRTVQDAEMLPAADTSARRVCVQHDRCGQGCGYREHDLSPGQFVTLPAKAPKLSISRAHFWRGTLLTTRTFRLCLLIDLVASNWPLIGLGALQRASVI